MKRIPKFSMIRPSLPAKNAIIILIKYLSCSLSFLFHSSISLVRSTSSTRQKQSTCFLYICHISGFLIGNITYLDSSGVSSGSGLIGLSS